MAFSFIDEVCMCVIRAEDGGDMFLRNAIYVQGHKKLQLDTPQSTYSLP